MALNEKTALITGSTSGIGLAIAQGFAQQGINIILNGFGNPEEIEDIRKTSVKVTYSNADMTKPSEIASMIQSAEAEFGAIDILVNNAGIQHVSPIEDFPPEKWEFS